MWPLLKASWGEHDWSVPSLLGMFWQGLKDSKNGAALDCVRRGAGGVNPGFCAGRGLWGCGSAHQVSGLFLTLLAATLIEVCSEGSTPIAADLFNRAGAPGNAFTFLMAGAATDYTEIMAVKDTTRSWKIALFLPLVTVPQVLFIGWLMNLTVL